MSANETATLLLDQAQTLVQERGFNAFSYKDLAKAVGIRTASIHYHFPSKGDLGVALMQRYSAGLEGLLTSLDARRSSHLSRLKGLIDAYAATEAKGAICLCGSLASDLNTLPEHLAGAVAAYLDRSLAWIQTVLEDGIREGEFTPKGKPADLAAILISSLQGALMLSRGSGGTPLIARVRRSFLHSLESA